MLNSARQIIANVPGKHLDPLLLVRSQSKDSQGYVMIAYNSESQDSAQNPSRFVDLIFFRGPEISECVRVGSDIRFNIAPDSALSTFHSINRETDTFIHLFEVPDAVSDLFRLTLSYAPCLIVPIDKLTSKVLCRLLESTGCQRGIIECNDFSSPFRSLHLTAISSIEDVTNYCTPFKRGRILVYDTARNKDLVQQRSTTRPSISDRHTPVPVEEQPKGLEPARVFVQSSNGHQEPFGNDTLSPEDEHEAEEFSALIKQILNSSSEPQMNTSPYPPLKGRESKPQRRETKPTTRLTKSHSEKHTPEPQSPPISDFTRLFERSFRSFRQQLSEVMGSKAEEAIASATRKIQAQSPDFRLESLSDETAASVIDLIELISVDAPFLKRSRLRQAALTLVADLYNKQYELLEKHCVIDKVEQCYYRLKK